MRVLLIGILALTFAGAALALDVPELDSRVARILSKLEQLQQRPDKAIPAEHLRKAQGIVLMDRTKAGFIFAYQGGSGIALVKDKSGKWGPLAFMTATEASLGFQIGGQQSFIAVLFMTTNATRLLTQENVQFGGEARGTAGEESTGAEGLVEPISSEVLVYTDRKGLYGGAAIKGGAMSPDDTANRIYYNQFVTLEEILFQRKVKPNAAAEALAKKLSGYAQLARQ